VLYETGAGFYPTHHRIIDAQEGGRPYRKAPVNRARACPVCGVIKAYRSQFFMPHDLFLIAAPGGTTVVSRGPRNQPSMMDYVKWRDHCC
jgi:hypothetical protein